MSDETLNFDLTRRHFDAFLGSLENASAVSRELFGSRRSLRQSREINDAPLVGRIVALTLRKPPDGANFVQLGVKGG
jgi:hypothetical protein